MSLSFHRRAYIPPFALRNLLPDYRANSGAKKRIAYELETEFDKACDALPTPSAMTTEETLVIIWGERDRLFTAEIGTRTAALLRTGGNFTMIPATGHAPNLEAPASFNNRVLSFLRPI